MERVHYRRYTPSRLHSHQRPQPVMEYDEPSHTTPKPKQSETSESGGFREKFIVQGIISGVILAVILVFSMVDDPQVANIRANLSLALSDHITAEQVSIEVRRLLGNESQEAFVAEPAYIETVSDQDMYYPYLETEVFAPSTEVTPGLTEEQIATPRIDEDMLREVFGWTEGDDLQTTAPEPIVPPEL